MYLEQQDDKTESRTSAAGRSGQRRVREIGTLVIQGNATTTRLIYFTCRDFTVALPRHPSYITCLIHQLRQGTKQVPGLLLGARPSPVPI
jgi:hypothetical protein